MIVQLRDGLKVNVLESGSGEATPLLLIHGLGGSAETWGEEILGRLSRDRRVVAVDLPGHGASDAPTEPGRFALAAIVSDLEDVLSCLDIESAIWAGYSMGGRIALGAGLFAPQRVAALILESASPGLEDELARQDRRRSDERLARRMESDGIQAYLDAREELPVFASQRRLAPEVRRSLRDQLATNDPAALAACLRGLGQGMQPPLWRALGHISAPVLLLVGALDEKYLRINEQMLVALPAARLVVAPAAGHNVHFETPGAWLSAVETFL